MCEYEFYTGKKCKEKALPNSKYCILHIDFPKNGEEFTRIIKRKEEKVKEKVTIGDFDFEGVKLHEVNFSDTGITGIPSKDDITGKAVNFRDATIEYVRIDKSKIDGGICFDKAKIGYIWSYGTKVFGNATFAESEILGEVSFEETEIGGEHSFEKSKIKGHVIFEKGKIGREEIYQREDASPSIMTVVSDRPDMAREFFQRGAPYPPGRVIKGHVLLYEAEIEGDVSFEGCEIEGFIDFTKARIGGYVSFNGAMINGWCNFDTAEIGGKLTFYKTKFQEQRSQENACRSAKKKSLRN